MYLLYVQINIHQYPTCVSTIKWNYIITNVYTKLRKHFYLPISSNIKMMKIPDSVTNFTNVNKPIR